jgi:hypothetical protein
MNSRISGKEHRDIVAIASRYHIRVAHEPPAGDVQTPLWCARSMLSSNGKNASLASETRKARPYAPRAVSCSSAPVFERNMLPSVFAAGGAATGTDVLIDQVIAIRALNLAKRSASTSALLRITRYPLFARSRVQ